MTTQVGALDLHRAEHGGSCSSSYLTPRTEAFYNAQRLARKTEEGQHSQARCAMSELAAASRVPCSYRVSLASRAMITCLDPAQRAVLRGFRLTPTLP